MSTAPIARPIVSEQTIARIGRLMLLANALIASCAAVLSYDALRLLAVAEGVPGALAWMFPLILDGTIAAASLSTLTATLQGRRATYPWLLVLAFTGFSLLGNVLHGHQTPVGWFVAALPPVGFALVWHLLLHHRQQAIVLAAEKAAAQAAAAAAEEERQRRAEERAARAAATPAQTTSRPVPRQRTTPAPAAPVLRVAETTEPNIAATVPASPVKGVSEELLDQARPIFAAEPGISGAELGALLGKSDKTGRNLLRALRAEATATETAAIADLAVTG